MPMSERTRKTVRCSYCTEEGRVERDCLLKTTLRDTWKSEREVSEEEITDAAYASAPALISTTSRIANGPSGSSIRAHPTTSQDISTPPES